MFQPYGYPFPNMLVQKGRKVRIGGLQSEAGQKYNGATGTALRFFPESGRWTVQLDGGGGDGDNDSDSNKNNEAAGVAATIAKEKEEPLAGPNEQPTVMTNANKKLKIHITNLTFAPDESVFLAILGRNNPSWSWLSENGQCLVRAGTTSDGKPAIAILDSPGSVDEHRLREEASRMGIPPGIIDGFLKTELGSK